MQQPHTPVESTIILNEEVVNLEKHQLANPSYFPCYVQKNDDSKVPALFTQREIEVAIDRARKNMEDLGEASEEELSWFERIFG